MFSVLGFINMCDYSLDFHVVFAGFTLCSQNSNNQVQAQAAVRLINGLVLVPNMNCVLR